MTNRTINVGVLGCGSVGSVLVERLLKNTDAIAARSGVSFQVMAVGVRDLKKSRSADIPTTLFTDNLASIVENPEIDVVVEVMGGINPARDLILAALRANKPVITANKELLATHPEVLSEAASCGVDLLFEAAVGGGIPVIRPLKESLAGESITRVLGIVNGTTNFILTAMEQGASYADALSTAQALGYAEPDPTADVSGRDGAAKAAILASLAFSSRVVLDDVYCEGISGLPETLFGIADDLDATVKLLGIVERLDDGRICARVHPTLVPESHPLAAVRDVFNAIFIEGNDVGEIMLYGRGAGGEPTASAIMGDLIDAAHNLRGGGGGRVPEFESAPLATIDDAVSAFVVELFVRDEPGVLATVAAIFGEHDVSISSVEQTSWVEGARVLFVTHVAKECDVTNVVEAVAKLDVVSEVGMVVRMLAP